MELHDDAITGQIPALPERLEQAAFNLLVGSYPAPCRAKRLGGGVGWRGGVGGVSRGVIRCNRRTRVGMNNRKADDQLAGEGNPELAESGRLAPFHEVVDAVSDEGDDHRVHQKPGPPAVGCKQQSKPPSSG
jgi:hypothetical protein